MVVRFVRVIRVPACARVSRVCPGPPRRLFTGPVKTTGTRRPATPGYGYYTVFDLVSLAGISGTMEPRGIFSMAVPAEVLAAALAEDGSRRSRPGAVPDYCFTVDGRRMLYDVKRISFCPTRYWPTVAVASSRGGALEYRASLVRTG